MDQKRNPVEGRQPHKGGFFAKAKNSALSQIKSRVRINLHSPAASFSAGRSLKKHGGLKEVQTMKAVQSGVVGSPETPDIVSSCDKRSEVDSDNLSSKRNSLEMDESLGILSPGEMKDFTASSMTQSLASVSSLTRDVSWDELNTESVTDNTMTEDLSENCQERFNCEEHVGRENSSGKVVATAALDRGNLTKGSYGTTIAQPTASNSYQHHYQAAVGNWDLQIAGKTGPQLHHISRISRPVTGKHCIDDQSEIPEAWSDNRHRTIHQSSSSPGRTGGSNTPTHQVVNYSLSSSPGPHRKSERQMGKSEVIDGARSSGSLSPLLCRRVEKRAVRDVSPLVGSRRAKESEMTDATLSHRSSSSRGSIEGRFCLDSSKLEEIEALTSTSPVPPVMLNNIPVSPPLRETSSLPPRTSEGHEDLSVAQMLFEKTESLLRKSPTKHFKEDRTGQLNTREKVTLSDCETKSMAPSVNYESQEYSVQPGRGKSLVNVPGERGALEGKIQSVKLQALSPQKQDIQYALDLGNIGRPKNVTDNFFLKDSISFPPLECKKDGIATQPSSGACNAVVDRVLSDQGHNSEKYPVSTALSGKHDRNKDLHIMEQFTGISPGRVNEKKAVGVIEKISGEENSQNLFDQREAKVSEEEEERIQLLINKHLHHVKQASDIMADSLSAKSDGDSVSQDFGIGSMSGSMPSSMISSNSMVLSFAHSEMDSSGFFSESEGGRMSGSHQEGDLECGGGSLASLNKTQISPITENSEPENSEDAERSMPSEPQHTSAAVSSLPLRSFDEDDGEQSGVLEDDLTSTQALMEDDLSSNPAGLTCQMETNTDDNSITSASSIEVSDALVAKEMMEDIRRENNLRIELTDVFNTDDVLDHYAIQNDAKRRRGQAGYYAPEERRMVRKRSQEKGLATRRSEMLSDKPILPNRNVGSKLKAMLTENKNCQEVKEPRVRKPSRWDAVMNKIEQGKSEPARPIKEVKSKVFANFIPPSLPLRKVSNLLSPRDGCVSGSINSLVVPSPRVPVGETRSSSRRSGSRRTSRADSSSRRTSRADSPTESISSQRTSPRFLAGDTRSNSMVSTVSVTSNFSEHPDLSPPEVTRCPTRSNSNISSSCSTRSSVSRSRGESSGQGGIRARGEQKGFSSKPVGPPAGRKVSLNNRGSSTTTTTTIANRKVSSTSCPGGASYTRRETKNIRNRQNLTPSVTDENKDPGQAPRALQREGSGSSGGGVAQPPHHGQQPDLVKVGPGGSTSMVSAQHLEIDRLEGLLETGKRELEIARQTVGANTRGVSVMSVLLCHLKQQDSFQSGLIIHLKDDLKKVKCELEDGAKEKNELQNLLEKDKEQHTANLKELTDKYTDKERELLETQKKELKSVTEDSETHLNKKGKEYKDNIKNIEKRHIEERTEMEKEHVAFVEKMLHDQAEKEERLKTKWADEKKGMDEDVKGLKGKVQGLEENLLNGSDYRIKSAHAKMKNLQQEIDSLKMVVEMRTTEIHELRAEKVKLDEKLELFDLTQVSIKKFQAQVEDLKEQLAARVDTEQQLMEENRSLHKMVHKENSEKKRLSMENEQLSWKMSQSREGYSNSEDSGYLGSSETGPLSMSYCEGTAHSLPFISSPRFLRGSRPLSAPPGKFIPGTGILFTEGIFDPSQPLPPDSPRVLEVVEKSESVSWKLEYEAAGSQTSLTSSLITEDGASAGASPIIKRKLSPQSPLLLRKCKSNGMTNSRERSGLMTRSLDLGPGSSGLARSNSYTSGSKASYDGSHAVLQRTASLIQRNGSVRRKILPSFETLSESTESESDESKKNSPGDRHDIIPCEVEVPRNLKTPAPVDIVSSCTSDDDMCEISSSSEIEIGGDEETRWTEEREQEEESESEPGSPDTEPEVTLRADLSFSHSKSVGVARGMNSSLPSYDLARLFHYSPPSISGGESLVCQEEVSSQSSESEGHEELDRVMTDSLSTVSWPDEWTDHHDDPEC